MQYHWQQSLAVQRRHRPYRDCHGTNRVTLFSVPEAKYAATCEMPESIVAIRADAEGRHLAVLNDRGLCACL